MVVVTRRRARDAISIVCGHERIAFSEKFEEHACYPLGDVWMASEHLGEAGDLRGRGYRGGWLW